MTPGESVHSRGGTTDGRNSEYQMGWREAGQEEGKRDEAILMINGNLHDWKSNKQDSSPPFVNVERQRRAQ